MRDLHSAETAGRWENIREAAREGGIGKKRITKPIPRFSRGGRGSDEEVKRKYWRDEWIVGGPIPKSEEL